MNKKQGIRSKKREGYYLAQRNVTKRNKERRVARLKRLFPKYKAEGYE